MGWKSLAAGQRVEASSLSFAESGSSFQFPSLTVYTVHTPSPYVASSKISRRVFARTQVGLRSKASSNLFHLYCSLHSVPMYVRTNEGLAFRSATPYTSAARLNVAEALSLLPFASDSAELTRDGPFGAYMRAAADDGRNSACLCHNGPPALAPVCHALPDASIALSRPPDRQWPAGPGCVGTPLASAVTRQRRP